MENIRKILTTDKEICAEKAINEGTKMITNFEYTVYFGVVLVYCVKEAGFVPTSTLSPTTTSSNGTTTNSTGTTTSSTATSTTFASTTALAGGTVELTNNGTPMVVGIAVGISVVVIAIIVTAVTFACLKKKKVYPCETETIFSDSISESDYDSRPTTASHIFVEQPEDPPSRPVTMTFPFENWKPGYDGILKPRMPLRFVHPSRYKHTKNDEQDFRKKIYQFEMTENLTISRPPSSTMMYARRSTYRSHVLDPVPERTVFQNGEVLHIDNGDILHSERYDDEIAMDGNNHFQNESTPIETFKDFNSVENEISEQNKHSLSPNDKSGSGSRPSAQNLSASISNSSHLVSKSVLNGSSDSRQPNEGDLAVEQYDDVMTTEL